MTTEKARSSAMPGVVADAVKPGHDFAADKTFNGIDRWTCRTCKCAVLYLGHGTPYGSATQSPCTKIAGQGFVRCSSERGCGGRWDWPGSFGSEQEARSWAALHASICRRPEVVVRRSPGVAR